MNRGEGFPWQAFGLKPRLARPVGTLKGPRGLELIDRSSAGGRIPLSMI